MRIFKHLTAYLFGAFLLLSPLVVPASVVMESAAGSPGSRLNEQLFTTVGANTFVVPNNVTTILVTGCAAGGGGAGGHTADPGGGGGGGSAGQCAIKMPVIVTAGSTLTFTVGTAGLAGAAGASGGIASLTSTITGIPYGTITLLGMSATFQASTGTVTNGGAGGGIAPIQAGGATGTGAGTNSARLQNYTNGGDFVSISMGASGGGATGPGAGGSGLSVGSYNSSVNVVGGSASGTKGGGGAGGSGPFGVGGTGGTNAAGNACTGYGSGGGGGAPTFAGSNGCQGFWKVQWWN